jgi:hypothetical protein
MNVERLYEVTNMLEKEFEKTEVVGRVERIKNYLQDTINQPSQPSHQENFSTELSNLFLILNQSKLNELSPGLIETIKEIGGEDLIGDKLSGMIQNIVQTNQITPSIALQQIAGIKIKLELFYNGLQSINAGFAALRIKENEYSSSDCEIGVSIPRKYVDNHLSDFGKEIGEINFILKTLAEFSTGGVDNFVIRSISSSDFTIYLLAGVVFVERFAAVLEKVIASYKTILEIKKLKQDLKSKGVSEKSLKGITEHANAQMTKTIEDIITEMYNKSKMEDDGRKNELKNASKVALNKLANRIDNGFNFEIRLPELPSSEDEIDENITDIEELVKSIFNSSKTLQYKKTEGAPILNLPEGNNEETE